MERITSDIHTLLNEAKLEVDNFVLAENENLIAYFSEYPSISGFPFRIACVEKTDGTVHSRFRQWDTEYDFTRWENGVYNLDRLRIISDEKVLSALDQEKLVHFFRKLEEIQLPQSLKDENALVLDGSDWSLGLKYGTLEINYSWKVATTDLALFVPLIELMKNQHKGINKRRSN